MFKNLVKLAFIGCLLSSSPFLVGCDVVYRMLDKEGAQEKELIGEILPFEKNPTVEEIQTLLDLYGYNIGRADGILGLQTRNGLERFQKDNNLKITRFADSETWAKLEVFKNNGFIYEGSLNVELIQSALNAAGISVGKVDGKMGPRTLRAVKKFQKQNDLTVDGKIGYKTLGSLSQHIQ